MMPFTVLHLLSRESLHVFVVYLTVTVQPQGIRRIFDKPWPRQLPFYNILAVLALKSLLSCSSLTANSHLLVIVNSYAVAYYNTFYFKVNNKRITLFTCPIVYDYTGIYISITKFSAYSFQMNLIHLLI